MEANRKRTQVHRLPTEDITNIVVFNDYLYLNNGYIEEDDQYLLGDATSNSHQEPKSAFEFQHLYFTTDEKIKEGDHFYNPATNEILFASKEMLSWNSDTTQEHKGWRKIISSTDPKLVFIEDYGYAKAGIPLPQPSQDFIKAYCKQGGIDEVDVEYKYHKVWDQQTEELLEKYLILKVDLIHNTITTHRIVEKMYSISDIEAYCEKYSNDTELGREIRKLRNKQ